MGLPARKMQRFDLEQVSVDRVCPINSKKMRPGIQGAIFRRLMVICLGGSCSAGNSHFIRKNYSEPAPICQEFEGTLSRTFRLSKDPKGFKNL
jgi:hypothetical protein